MSRRFDDRRRSELSMIDVLVIAIIIILAGIGLYSVVRYAVTHLHPVFEAQAETTENERVVVIQSAAASADVAISEPLLREYCEGDGPAPAWWNPDEPMAAEWEDVTDIIVGDIDVPRKDAGCPDWNLCTSLIGWSGHMMEVWEMDLLSRIVYLEFNGTELECINAGIDSILNLWDSGYFGRTIFETLSATAENGALVYTTYGYVWDWDYDYTVLQEIKTICAERFVNGPQYGCHFFQLYGFPLWAQPLYEIDQVYFSTFKEGTR